MHHLSAHIVFRARRPGHATEEWTHVVLVEPLVLLPDKNACLISNIWRSLAAGHACLCLRYIVGYCWFY